MTLREYLLGKALSGIDIGKACEEEDISVWAEQTGEKLVTLVDTVIGLAGYKGREEIKVDIENV